MFVFFYSGYSVFILCMHWPATMFNVYDINLCVFYPVLGQSWPNKRVQSIIVIFSFKEINLKMLSPKWQQFCLGLNELTYWGRDKQLPFCRRHFQMHFRQWKQLNFDYNFTDFCNQWSNWQYVRRQAITWANDDDSVPWCILCVTRPQWVNHQGQIFNYLEIMSHCHGWWTSFWRNGVRNDLCDWFASTWGAGLRWKSAIQEQILQSSKWTG